MMINDIKNLTWNQTLGVMFGFIGLISPGFLLIYLYKPELIASLETLKVIIFSLSLSMPVVIVNLAVNNELSEDDNFANAVAALFQNTVVFYPSLLISYVFSLAFTSFLIALAIIEVLIILITIFSEKHGKNKKT